MSLSKTKVHWYAVAAPLTRKFQDTSNSREGNREHFPRCVRSSRRSRTVCRWAATTTHFRVTDASAFPGHECSGSERRFVGAEALRSSSKPRGPVQRSQDSLRSLARRHPACSARDRFVVALFGSVPDNGTQGASHLQVGSDSLMTTDTAIYRIGVAKVIGVTDPCTSDRSTL